jgi:hypothetical protein
LRSLGFCRLARRCIQQAECSICSLLRTLAAQGRRPHALLSEAFRKGSPRPDQCSCVLNPPSGGRQRTVGQQVRSDQPDSSTVTVHTTRLSPADSAVTATTSDVPAMVACIAGGLCVLKSLRRPTVRVAAYLPNEPGAAVPEQVSTAFKRLQNGSDIRGVALSCEWLDCSYMLHHHLQMTGNVYVHFLPGYANAQQRSAGRLLQGQTLQCIRPSKAAAAAPSMHAQGSFLDRQHQTQQSKLHVCRGSSDSLRDGLPPRLHTHSDAPAAF